MKYRSLRRSRILRRSRHEDFSSIETQVVANPQGGTSKPSLTDGWVEIFRAGTYGNKGSFSAEDIDRVVRSYDPSFHEAPVCVGHPADDTPAFGWTAELKRDGDSLLAKFKDVDPAFAEAVRDRRYPKRSAAFYKGADGKISGLRHVAFLGGQPPEVKGLKEINFGDNGRTFTEVDFEEEAVATGDKTVKEQIAEFFSELFGNKGGAAQAATFSERDAQALVDRAVAAAVQPLQAKITAQEKALAEQKAEFAERERKLLTQEIKGRAGELIAGLKQKGKWIPAFDKMGLGVIFQELAKQTETIEFGEGDAKKTLPLADLLAQFVEGLPSIVPTGRLSNGAPTAAPNASVKDDALTAAARALQKAKDITFSEALDQVAKEHPELTVPGNGAAGRV